MRWGAVQGAGCGAVRERCGEAGLRWEQMSWCYSAPLRPAPFQCLINN